MANPMPGDWQPSQATEEFAAFPPAGPQPPYYTNGYELEEDARPYETIRPGYLDPGFARTGFPRPADPWDTPNGDYSFPATYTRPPDPWESRPAAQTSTSSTRALWIVVLIMAAVMMSILILRW